jgi:hypothetical protein
MRPGTWVMAGAALAAASMAAASAQPAGGTFSVRNDAGRTMECAEHKAGTMVGERVRLRAGEEWRRDFPKPKPRYFRCEGAAPISYFIRSGVRYRLAPTREGLIVLAPM